MLTQTILTLAACALRAIACDNDDQEHPSSVNNIFISVDLSVDGDLNFNTLIGDDTLETVGDELIEMLIDDYLKKPSETKLDRIDTID